MSQAQPTLRIRPKALAYAATGVVLLAAAALLDRPLLAVIGAVPLLLVVLQSWRSHAGLVDADRDVDTEARHFETEEIPVRLQVTNRAHGTRLLEVRDRLVPFARLATGSNHAFLVAKRGGQRTLAYDAAFPVFGVHEIGPLEVRAQDAFGFYETQQRVTEPDALTVEPSPLELDADQVRSQVPEAFVGPHEVSQPGTGFEFFGLRDYTRSDRMRDVNWKATSRVNRLVVNQHVKESKADVILLIDARATELAGDRAHCPWVQNGRAAVAVAQELVHRRDSIRVVFYGESVDEVRHTGQGRQLAGLIDHLVITQPEGAASLKDAVDELLPSLKPRSPVVIFSSFLNDPHAGDAVLRLAGEDNPLVVFTPKPDVQSTRPASRLVAHERRLLVGDLRGYGATVVELEPPEAAAEEATA